ncbi:MAG: ATP-binding cassette domain-containing protein [Alphaproteobacteria bacterium]|nr:ATP-binding cassette domain-containing protein [Alphaproteobacteria bacterium]
MPAINFKNVSLSFPHKICFENFTTHVQPGSRIGIIGRNGSGKSTLLQMMQGAVKPTDGEITLSPTAVVGYVPQIIIDHDTLSGGQRLNKALTHALVQQPTILLLDEPTNHLDTRHRKSLMRMMAAYSGTLIVVTHDEDLLRTCIDTLWHIDNERVHIFPGRYDDYRQEINRKRASIEKEVSGLNRSRTEMHHALMKEQERAKKSKISGEKKRAQNHWPTVVAGDKERQAESTDSRKKCEIQGKKQHLSDRLSELRLPEIIKPKFSIDAADIKDRTLVSIVDASVGYDKALLSKINLELNSRDRIVLMGDNASGKSTLIKGILGDPCITRQGNWTTPKPEDIGYLDQHYGTLSLEKTVIESIVDLVPLWSHAEIRSHLNDFLFRKNEEVNCSVAQLSGGEKARLSLAQIAAKTPKLLILDEVTNNLDLETRDHIIQVLKEYSGALIVISHDDSFLREISVTCFYQIEDGIIFSVNPMASMVKRLTRE